MASPITRAVWEQSKLNRGRAEFRLLLAIADHAWSDGVAFPQVDRLLRYLDLTERSLRRASQYAASELERRLAVNGWVVWRVLVPGLDEVDEARLVGKGLVLVEPFSPDPQVRDSDPLVRPSFSRRTINTKETSGGSPPDGVDRAKELVGVCIAECKTLGVAPMPKQLLGHVGRVAAGLLADGVAFDDLASAIRTLARKGLHPSTLASLVHEQRVNDGRNGRGDGATRGHAVQQYAAYDA